MAFDNRLTYLCYNNSDLIRDGYISSRIGKEYLPVDTFNENRLESPPKGVTYNVIRDSDTNEITAVIETKKQLPASKIKIEIDFSKVMKSAVSHPISPGSLSFTPMLGLVGTAGFSSIGMGGITSGLSYFTTHILDAETKINRKITVTQEMINTGIWVCDEGYPLSVFGIVTDHLRESEDPEIPSAFTNGLDFDMNDPLRDPTIIGKYSDGAWKGTRRKRISGATDSDGLFGGRATPDILFSNVAYDDQPQIFDKIVKDNRKLKFRGDNHDAPGGKDFPFRLTGREGIDATDKQIRLKLTDNRGKPLFKVGDSLFITYSVASERHVRQNLNHRGDIGQGNTIGIIGFRGAFRSEVDAFDYQISTWKVPTLPQGLTMSNIDEIDDFYTEDSDYKLSLSEYVKISKKASTSYDSIEGWRLSESITNGHIKKFWAADYRGILLYDNGDITIVFPESQIRDKEWFKKYLQSLPFIFPSGGIDRDGNPIYVTKDYQQKIEDRFDEDSQPGFLYDLTEHTNSLLFDREKIPYYRFFADALKDIGEYVEGDYSSGVGVVLLDLLALVENNSSISSLDLSLFDLSKIEFRHSNAQPLKRFSCDELYKIYPYHYWSESYDSNTLNEGMGAWYDSGDLKTDVFGWYPAGGSIESYWKLETPYFCGDYSRKSRIYTEMIAGPSLDNYSWIFTDTEPFVPYNISADFHKYFDEGVVVFNDDNVHYGLSYYKLIDSRFNNLLPVIEQDESLSHVREAYDYEKNFMIGQNRLIGDYPSYSHGSPILNDKDEICRTDKEKEYWYTEEIYNNASYGLNFNNDIPKANIPSGWFIRSIIITFSTTNFNSLTEIDRNVSFYFEGSDSSISDIIIRKYTSNLEEDRAVIDFKYYHSGPLQFLGGFWKKQGISSIKIRYVNQNDSRNISNINIDNYKIKSGQNAVVYDGLGRFMVFYSDPDYGNISVAISDDDGQEWKYHKNIIRLIEGEVAGMPFVVGDTKKGYIHLFFTLNDSFLMYKRLNTELFVDSDVYVEGKIPTSYDVDDYDQTAKDPEKEYWGEYSDSGNFLRRTACYFVAGDASDPYFVDQMRIRNDLIEGYLNSLNENTRQYPRFEFSGALVNMDDAFKGDSYSIYMDDEGVLRLFMISNGKLSIKRSSDYFSWKYDIKEQLIHKDYIDDEQNKGIAEDIQNIQIVRNNFTAGWVSVLYFHNGMLFIRHFQSDLLFPFYDSNGNLNNSGIIEHIGVDNVENRPIFLVGKIPDSMRQKRIEEINNGITSENSELYIYFPYSKEMIEKFDDRFSIDADTQVYAFTNREGIVRIFYKDSFGNLEGIILNSSDEPTLEVMNKFRKS
jgi:hypothetical protein